MDRVVQFVPKAERDAAANLAEFVRVAREDLTAFGDGGAWGCDRWCRGKTVAVFGTQLQRLDAHHYTPMADPFKQFAKAYIRYAYSHRPVRSVSQWVAALRCVEAALLRVRGRAEVGLINGAVMDVSAQNCRDFYLSDDLKCQVGRRLQAIFDFCRNNGLVSALPPWASPFRKPKILTEDLGEEGKQYRATKLPSNASMLAVAELFVSADEPESRFFSSIMILLMMAPSRISEVLALPVDCVQWENDSRGEPQMYLRWRAAKGMGPMKKWVVSAMRDVVQEAVRRLVEIGAPAREAARFAHEYPGQFMPYPGCVIDLARETDRLLTPSELCAAIGLKLTKSAIRADGAATWPSIVVDKGLKPIVASREVTYRKLAEYVQKRYAGNHWPFIDASKTVRAWGALCLHRENEFHKDFAVKPFSWRLPTANEVNTRLSNEKGLSLFERARLRNQDGSAIKMTSHQLRHWLNTMAERTGMDDYTLAKWAGRANPRDNRHYDHRTPEEQLDAARQLIGEQKPSLLERFKTRQPVTYRELGVDRPGIALATLYGMCTHDYSMTPCQKQRQCLTCKEHVCVKGDYVTLDRVRVLEGQLQHQLVRAQHAHEDGIFGADRWVDNLKWRFAHAKTMRLTLESKGVPDGSLVRIPDGHDPSPVRRALMDCGVADTASPKLSPLHILPPVLSNNVHAQKDHH